MGKDEFDRRLAAIQPRRGARRWGNGISGLKQVTGREYRELERLSIQGDDEVTQAMFDAFRFITDYILTAQEEFFPPKTLELFLHQITTFPNHKQDLLDAGVRRRKKEHLKTWAIYTGALAQCRAQ